MKDEVTQAPTKDPSKIKAVTTGVIKQSSIGL